MTKDFWEVSDETKLWMVFWICLSVVISSIPISLCYYHTETERTAMEKGYTKKVISGSKFPQWVKD